MSPTTTSEVTGAPPGSGAMFDQIAHRYDLLNRVLSFGLDQSWRKLAVKALQLPATGHLLDVATGTGDVALMALAKYPGSLVTGIDPSEEMLAIGRQKLQRRGLGGRCELLLGNAESLPFESNTFNGITIAFGIRNVPDRQRALEEMKRVLAPGGRLVILELSEPPPGALGKLSGLHLHHFVPWLGGLISGAKEYRYLQRSIAAFPKAEDFKRFIEETGLVVEQVRPLSFGVAHIYVARKVSSE